MKFLVMLLTLLTLACIPAASQEMGELQARIDSIVQAEVRSKNLVSAAVLLDFGNRGRILSLAGVQNRQNQSPRDSIQPFRIASITKSMLATIVLQLVDEGKLKLSDPISLWFPDFPGGHQITINHLLQMRSGLYDSANQQFLQEYYANRQIDLNAQDMIARAAAHSAENSPPGQTTDYNNLNYMLLEQIASQVSGQEPSQLFRSRLFEPLGMKSSFYPEDDQLPGNLRGYAYVADGADFLDVTTMNPLPAGGAGAVISSLEDLNQWARALGQGKLLTPSSFASRQQFNSFPNRPAFIGYGQGIEKLGPFLGHNGTIFGFSTECFYLPQRDATLVISVNRLDADDESKSGGLFLQITKSVFPDLVNW